MPWFNPITELKFKKLRPIHTGDEWFVHELPNELPGELVFTLQTELADKQHKLTSAQHGNQITVQIGICVRCIGGWGLDSSNNTKAFCVWKIIRLRCGFPFTRCALFNCMSAYPHPQKKGDCMAVCVYSSADWNEVSKRHFQHSHIHIWRTLSWKIETWSSRALSLPLCVLSLLCDTNKKHWPPVGVSAMASWMVLIETQTVVLMQFVFDSKKW